MKHDTAKKACKHPKWIGHGAGRLICAACGKTRTVRPRRRGAKPRRRRSARLARTFAQHLTVRQQASRSGSSAGALAKSHAKDLESLLRRPWPHAAPRGRLIVVLDAMWLRVGGIMHAACLVGLRPVDGDELTFMPPAVFEGRESLELWESVIESLPEDVKRRVAAVVSDSFAGSGSIAERRGWAYQRCQAHLLVRLSTVCGDNKRAVSWREGRQEAKRLLRAALLANDEREAAAAAASLARLASDPDCPKGIRQIIKRTLATLHEYRTCFTRPELRLPATTNAVENTNGRIRSVLSRSRGFRTPRSLLRWIYGYLWFHPKVACRPKLTHRN
jgi:hypothetical protein